MLFGQGAMKPGERRQQVESLFSVEYAAISDLVAHVDYSDSDLEDAKST